MRSSLIVFLICILCSLEVTAQEDYLYGTTMNGGKYNGGVLYKVKSNGSQRQVLYDFRFISPAFPNGKVVKDSQGTIYGTSANGGDHFGGTLFSFNISQDKFEVLHHFDNDSLYTDPIDFLYLYEDSLLIGATRDGYSIFRYHLPSKQIDLLKAFESINGNYALFNAFEYKGKTLVSAYNNQGSTQLFEFDFVRDSAWTFLDTDSLILNQAFQFNDSVFLGTALLPKTNFLRPNEGKSYLYKFDPRNDSLSILRQLDMSQEGFQINENLIQINDSTVIGSCLEGGQGASGNLFNYDFKNNIFHLVSDPPAWVGGSNPSNLVRKDADHLIGVYFSSSSSFEGLIFEYSIGQDSIYSILDLQKEIHGERPRNVFSLNEDTLLVLCANGGGQANGTLLSYDLMSDSIKVQLRFRNSKKGATPYGNLIQMGPRVIGSTGIGPAQYQIDLVTDDHSPLQNGQSSRLYSKFDSLLFFSTFSALVGPAFLVKYDQYGNSLGSLQMVDSSFRVQNPTGLMLKHSNGKMYGVGVNDGRLNQGCIYEFDPSNDEFSIIYSFGARPDIGNNPSGSLVEDPNGNLIGIARKSNSFSTLFRFEPVSRRLDSLTTLNLSITPEYGFDIYKDSLLLGIAKSFNTLFLYKLDLSSYTLEIMDTINIGGTPYALFTRPLINDSGEVYYSLMNTLAQNSGKILKYNIREDSLYTFIDFSDSSNVYGANPNELLFIDPFITSLEEMIPTPSSSLLVFPNPFEEQFTIRSEEDISDIIILDMNGKVVVQINGLKQKEITINLELKDGFYILQTFGSDHRHQQKIIKW